MSGGTPKKAVGKREKPRETNDISESDFCRICKCTFRISVGNFGNEKAGYISTENIFEVPERGHEEKARGFHSVRPQALPVPSRKNSQNVLPS